MNAIKNIIIKKVDFCFDNGNKQYHLEMTLSNDAEEHVIRVDGTPGLNGNLLFVFVCRWFASNNSDFMRYVAKLIYAAATDDEAHLTQLVESFGDNFWLECDQSELRVVVKTVPCAPPLLDKLRTLMIVKELECTS